jgi:FkbM family methyltransferase
LGFRATNAILHALGLRLQRTDSPTRTFRDFFDHLRARGMMPRTVIDVGVGYGTEPLYAAFPEASFFLIEPLEEFRPKLEQLARTLRAKYELVAAAAHDGEVVLNVHRDLTGSSSLLQAEGAVLDGAPRVVPAARLDGLLPPSLTRPLLLKVDTQGTELDVLDGLGARIAEVDVVVIETSLMPFRVGAPELRDVVVRLDALGFAPYDILEGHTRALDGALAQVDLAFVRKDGPLREDSRFFSVDQAERYARG